MLPTTLSNRLQQMVDAIQNYKQDIAIVFGDEALEIFNMMQALAAEAKIAVDAKPLTDEFVVVTAADDWTILFKNGEWVEQGHRITDAEMEAHITNLRFIEDYDALDDSEVREDYKPPTIKQIDFERGGGNESGER